MQIFGYPLDLDPILLTLEVAGITTVVLLIIGTPIAWALSQMRSRARIFLEALVALPLVLPPTVLGFYLIIALNPNGEIAHLLKYVGYDGQLTFNKMGLIIGSVIYSLPFTVQPIMAAFEALPTQIVDAARTMRASFLDRFFTVIVPLARQGFLVGSVLTFAHTVGEFGVVLMVGGNIEGQTRTVSIAIFDHVESFEYAEAHMLSIIMVIFSMFVLMFVYALNRKLQIKQA
ncbi:MAG: molybdenum ABC transporter permease subunit [Halothiobacillus sp. 24-54-40]|jgi:molybdate transport system permease protein|nr:MAG: molybdenum ABC transporter permease subunit [Halothiobacillus sp. 20-53-49]OYY31514.1 MAG: molybdenum ABC transporter permease subunit [Halothiobacillus sp. 35-54-62]OYY54609.1 MAG: molybdenum ABC transporter permease subunit [Halothiobacillus sp. 28-55-5]OYZ85174.1 MAG: molybdenum ABC transporter permease subunit [Halothiobacillus sp. 24-54-40]OZA78996.1 MAG: molybdenum ABC transporter permease subunit [Halothiobacillus sp. 39-53-45]HQS03968.1 molybdate ABC transporter permease subuni